MCNHCQTQTRDHQFPDALQAIACDQPAYRHDTSVRREFRTQRQNQERTRTHHHADCKLGWHRQGIAHLVIDSGQNRTTDDDPERVQCLILLRFYGQTQNGVLNVTNRKEVQ
ncbi:Uncharacterised protein [Shigella sonnei]|nr:Uncharacterised protein [Shigella sonnei]CSG39552.1 Uncharacterised protein [Shigella sonnei]